jgi:hypothetical protein
LLPLIRRRIPAWGGQPIATVTHKGDNFSLYRAVEPPPGDRCFRALPWLNTWACQRWGDHVAEAFPASCPILVLDNGALPKAKAWQWPPHVPAVFLPPYSPELTPIERLWREVKDQLADCVTKTLDELSAMTESLLQSYSPAALPSLTSSAYFVEAVTTTLNNRNG